MVESFAAHHGIGRKRFLEQIGAQMTRTKRGCLEQTAERTGAALPEVDLAGMGLTKIVVFLLSARLSPRHAPILVNG